MVSPAAAASSDFCQSRHGKQLEREKPQPAGEMRAEEHDESPFGGFHERLLGPAEEAVERRLAAKRLPERPEVERQEEGERDPRQAVNEKRPPGGMVAGADHAAASDR